MKIYEALAHGFQREGLTHCFALLGDANMHWAGALSDLGVKFIYTRHEHGAVAAATAYGRATGTVSCATVTCGPGLTQIMTILPIAVRARIPMVVFAGEAPVRKGWYNQAIDQAPFVEACGAPYRVLDTSESMMTDLHDAFVTAKEKRLPIVVSMPFDLQQDEWTGDLDCSTPAGLFVAPEPPQPDAALIKEAASWVRDADRPLLLAGLGVVAADAKHASITLAERSGALLATTLPAKGLFHDADFCLGVAGGFATERAKAIFKETDLVIAIGARVASHSFDAGRLTPDARVIHIDLDPQTEVQGRKAADLLIKADARLGAEALTEALEPRQGWRTPAMRQRCADALDLPGDHETPDGFLHPMAVVKHLAEITPPTCHIINTSGHSAYYTAQMNKHPQDHYTVIREFGAIGNGTSFALGLAEAHPDRAIIVIDGDGSALMHIQELETMVRHKMHILIIVLNDGAYGSEVHKLRADGVSEAGSVFGRPDFAGIGRGFGLVGETFHTVDNLRARLNAFLSQSGPAIFDITISDKIASPQILKAHKA